MIAPLSGSITSQDALLFKVSDNASILDSIVTPLLEISGCSCPGMIHTFIQQRHWQ